MKTIGNFSGISKDVCESVAKTYDTSREQVSTDRQLKPNVDNQPTFAIPRSMSALNQIKDQNYEKVTEEKLNRINRIKESRRKYSKQKLKSKKRDDSAQTKQSNGKAKEIKGSFIVACDKLIKDVKAKRVENKENLVPQVQVNNAKSNENTDKSKSTSILVIPRMKNINSKLSTREKFRREENKSCQNVLEEIKNESNKQTSRTNRILTEDCKARTQLVKIIKNENINATPNNKLESNNLVNDYADDTPDIEIEYSTNQYKSVSNFSNIQKNNYKNEIPLYKKTTYSIQRKMRSKVEQSPSTHQTFGCRINQKNNKSVANLLTERNNSKEAVFDINNWEMNCTSIDENTNQFSELYSIDCQTDFDNGMEELRKNIDINNYDYEGVFCYLDGISPQKERRNIRVKNNLLS